MCMWSTHGEVLQAAASFVHINKSWLAQHFIGGITRADPEQDSKGV